MQVIFEIPDEVLGKLPAVPDERDRALLTDFVCGLYADWKVNSAEAARWLRVSRLEFWR